MQRPGTHVYPHGLGQFGGRHWTRHMMVPLLLLLVLLPPDSHAATVTRELEGRLLASEQVESTVQQNFTPTCGDTDQNRRNVEFDCAAWDPSLQFKERSRNTPITGDSAVDAGICCIESVVLPVDADVYLKLVSSRARTGDLVPSTAAVASGNGTADSLSSSFAFELDTSYTEDLDSSSSAASAASAAAAAATAKGAAATSSTGAAGSSVINAGVPADTAAGSGSSAAPTLPASTTNSNAESQLSSTSTITVGSMVEVTIEVGVNGLGRNRANNVQLRGFMRGFKVVDVIQEPPEQSCSYDVSCPTRSRLWCRWTRLSPQSSKYITLRLRAVDAGAGAGSRFSVRSLNSLDVNLQNNLVGIVANLQGACCTPRGCIDTVRKDCPEDSMFAPWTSCGYSPCSSAMGQANARGVGPVGVCMLNYQCYERIHKVACMEVDGVWSAVQHCRELMDANESCQSRTR